MTDEGEKETVPATAAKHCQRARRERSKYCFINRLLVLKMEEIHTEEKHPLGRIYADNDRKFRKKYIVVGCQ